MRLSYIIVGINLLLWGVMEFWARDGYGDLLAPHPSRFQQDVYYTLIPLFMLAATIASAVLTRRHAGKFWNTRLQLIILVSFFIYVFFSMGGV